jgi:hypothetical protein
MVISRPAQVTLRKETQMEKRKKKKTQKWSTFVKFRWLSKLLKVSVLNESSENSQHE